MTNASTAAQPATEVLLGDVSSLVAQIGSADCLASFRDPAGSPRIKAIRDAGSLHRFLSAYRSQILLALELPAIHQAYQHACRGETRELIALDRRLAKEPLMAEFAAASQRVGKSQLKRLRPLRDQRVVQRYARAVQAGEAHAWHTLVYGLVLALYSIPLRPGLLGYARQTTRGFVDAVARDRHLAAVDCERVFKEICSTYTAAIEGIVTLQGNLLLPV
jgi:urease accessory protein UreF